MLRFRLSPKLRLAPLWPALAAVATAGLLLAWLLPGILAKSASGQLLDTLRLVEPLLQPRLSRLGATADPTLQPWVEKLTAKSGLRITLVAQEGRVLADSAVGGSRVPEMDNHGARPEVRAAFARGEGIAVRRSSTFGRMYVYAAIAVRGIEGRRLVLRLAEPLSAVPELTRQLATALGLAALVALLAILLTSLWLDRRLFTPLAGLMKGAADLASGAARRVPVPEEEDLSGLALALNRLAETAEAQFAAVRSERDQLKAILASMSEGVLVVGGDGRALLANPALCDLFALEGEVTGRPVLELIRHPELVRLVEDTLVQGEAQSGQVELQSPERRTLLLASAALSGGERGAVVVVRDTTELTRVADMRRDFVANVSHELKTPLAAIRGYAETLRDGALDEPPTAIRFTDRILWQCRRLQALLDDLLTLSRLESVALPPRREAVDLPLLARRAVEVLAAAAAEKRIDIHVEGGVMPLVSGDPDGLERLLLNLLDNAIKYNRPEGRIDVRLEAPPGQTVIEVADTGIGIPQDALARIFERFYRVDKGRAREEGGTGLGLAIVKHVAQAHGGQVEVESRIGRGTTFRVRLPQGGVEPATTLPLPFV